MASTVNTPNPSRRAMLGLFVAAPLIAAPAIAQAAGRSDAEKFMEAMQAIHPNGRRAAKRALDAGMMPSAFSTGIFSFANNTPAEDAPALIFNAAGGCYRTFRPRGEDN